MHRVRRAMPPRPRSRATERFFESSIVPRYSCGGSGATRTGRIPRARCEAVPRAIITARPYRDARAPVERRYVAVRPAHRRARSALGAWRFPPIGRARMLVDRQTANFSRCGKNHCVIKIRGARHKFPVSRCRKTFRNTKRSAYLFVFTREFFCRVAVLRAPSGPSPDVDFVPCTDASRRWSIPDRTQAASRARAGPAARTESLVIRKGERK